MENNTVGSLLRSSQAFCSELCEKETLDYGIAYYSRRFAALPEANQLREVWIEDPTEITVAFEQAEHWFTENSVFCHRWAPAGGQANPQLTGFLEERGFQRRDWLAMALQQWNELPAAGEVRVLPARAMRAAFRQTYVEDSRPSNARMRELLADAYVERLDDPQLDMYVALVGKKPAGRAGLYQVGDIARIVDLTVLRGFESHGVENALLDQVLSLAKRLSFRKVLVQIDGADQQRVSVFEHAGFVSAGKIVEFEREAPADLIS
jgi:N-acetylglutamate synthase-like GNAT family acetyltransferase